MAELLEFLAPNVRQGVSLALMEFRDPDVRPAERWQMGAFGECIVEWKVSNQESNDKALRCFYRKPKGNNEVGIFHFQEQMLGLLSSSKIKPSQKKQ